MLLEIYNQNKLISSIEYIFGSSGVLAIKVIVPPKKEYSIIICSPSCHSNLHDLSVEPLETFLKIERHEGDK